MLPGYWARSPSRPRSREKVQVPNWDGVARNRRAEVAMSKPCKKAGTRESERREAARRLEPRVLGTGGGRDRARDAVGSAPA